MPWPRSPLPPAPRCPKFSRTSMMRQHRTPDPQSITPEKNPSQRRARNLEQATNYRRQQIRSSVLNVDDSRRDARALGRAQRGWQCAMPLAHRAGLDACICLGQTISYGQRERLRVRPYRRGARPQGGHKQDPFVSTSDSTRVLTARSRLRRRRARPARSSTEISRDDTTHCWNTRRSRAAWAAAPFGIDRASQMTDCHFMEACYRRAGSQRGLPPSCSRQEDYTLPTLAVLFVTRRGTIDARRGRRAKRARHRSPSSRGRDGRRRDQWR